MTIESTQTTVSQNEKPTSEGTVAESKPVDTSYTDLMDAVCDQYPSDHWSRYLMLYVKNPDDLDHVMAGLSDDFDITLIPDEVIRTKFPQNYYPVKSLLGWCLVASPNVQLARSRMITNILAKISRFWPHLQITIADEPVETNHGNTISREYPVTFNHNSKK